MSIPKNHSTFSGNSNVSAQDRSEAIDFVNRLNFAFDHWNIAEMNDAFSKNCIVEHPQGRVEGRATIAKFLDAYKPLTVGIRCVPLNHIVDANEDGSLTVTYFNVFIRVTRAAETHLLKDQPMHDSNIGL
jgi:SnoaL-like domain